MRQPKQVSPTQTSALATTQLTTGSGSPITVSGLGPGQWTFTVEAVNAVGMGSNSASALATVTSASKTVALPGGVKYYVDPINGSDSADGVTIGTPWKTIDRAANVPGLSQVLLKRGTVVTTSGAALSFPQATPDSPIAVSSYGTGSLPLFTARTAASGGTFGDNTITVTGSNVIIDSIASGAGFMGIDVFGDNVTVQQCDISAAGVGLTFESGSVGGKAWSNNIHDMNVMVVNTPSPTDDDYGANGVALGGNGASVCFNIITRCRAKSDDWGYDGGAVEVFGGSNNIVAYNQASDCQGFCELGSTCSGNIIHHNVYSDSIDGSAFVNQHISGEFAGVSGTVVVHNTAVLTGVDSIAVVVGGSPTALQISAQDNLWVAAAASYEAGTGYSHNGFFGAVAAAGFVNGDAANYHLAAGSAARGAGVGTAHDSPDFDGVPYVGSKPDQGAYQYVA